jgi:hypothetical protein
VCLLAAALTLKYLFDHYDFTSSGAISALVQGLLAKELWKRGLPKRVAGARRACLSLTLHSSFVNACMLRTFRIKHACMSAWVQLTVPVSRQRGLCGCKKLARCEREWLKQQLMICCTIIETSEDGRHWGHHGQ